MTRISVSYRPSILALAEGRLTPLTEGLTQLIESLTLLNLGRGALALPPHQLEICQQQKPAFLFVM